MTLSLSTRLRSLLVEHATRYPHLQVQDVYKLLYQACMGSGHSIRDAAQARASLEDEIHQLTPDPLPLLIEQISPEARLERRIVRVNLRPYLAATSDITPLLDAFLSTSNTFASSIQRLQQVASLVRDMPVPPGLSFSRIELNQFLDEMRSQNYPVIHHSQEYSLNYQPAYRVVAGLLVDSILTVCGVN